MATKTETVSVIEQVRVSMNNPVALTIGSILGGVVSLAAFVIIHLERPEFWSVKTALVAGALLFSAKSVFQWTSKAFDDSWKAGGWTVLVEGVMLVTDTHWLSWIMLGLLIGINAMAAGCNLALQDKAAHDARQAKAEKAAQAKARRLAKMQTGVAANDNSKARSRKVA